MAIHSPLHSTTITQSQTDKRTAAGLMIAVFVLAVLAYSTYAAYYSGSYSMVPGAQPAITSPANP